MKVLFVSSGKADGKPGPIVQEQGNSLIKKGIKVDFFAITKKGLLGHLMEAKRLRNVLSQTKYDIVHAHYGISAIVALLARKGNRMIVSFMGDDILGSNDADGRIKIGSLVLAQINKWLAKRFYDFSIVKSREMHKKLNVSNSEIIPNGVDCNLFTPLKKNESDKKQIIFVSNPERAEKNFSLAKKSVELLNDKSIELKCIYGKEQKDLVAFYNAADVLVLTSFHEGSPNVVKEAMACNCPVVSVNVGDVKELMENVEGCYLSVFDAENIKSNLLKAMEFRKNKIFTKGRDRIIERKLDSDSVAERIITLYKKVLV